MVAWAPITPAWEYRHERTLHRVGSTARRSQSNQRHRKLGGTRSARAPSLRYPGRSEYGRAHRLARRPADLIRPTLSVATIALGAVAMGPRRVRRPRHHAGTRTVRAIGRRDDVVRQHIPSYFMDNALPMMNGAVPFVSSPIRSSTPPRYHWVCNRSAAEAVTQPRRRVPSRWPDDRVSRRHRRRALPSTRCVDLAECPLPFAISYMCPFSLILLPRDPLTCMETIRCERADLSHRLLGKRITLWPNAITTSTDRLRTVLDGVRKDNMIESADHERPHLGVVN